MLLAVSFLKQQVRYSNAITVTSFMQILASICCLESIYSPHIYAEIS